MNTSTIETRKTPGKRLGVFLLGLAVAAAGSLAFAGGQANANAFSMEFDKGSVNLGFAFKNAPILPAPQAIPGTVSNPDFNPGGPVSPTNSPTVVSQTGTRLFDYNELDPAEFSQPGSPATTPLNSFTPIGCGSPVTFGMYAALKLGGNPATPGDLLLDPRPNNPFAPLLAQALPNAGAPIPGNVPYYRELKAGAIVPNGETIGGVPGPYPATDTVWQPFAFGPTPGTPIGLSGLPGLRGEANPLGYCPNPATGEASGVDTNGQIEIQSRDFKMPVMIVPNPLDGSPVPITLESDGPLGGTFDSATGRLDLSGDIEVRVLTGLATNPLGSYCSVPLPGREPGGFGQGTPRPDGKFGLTTSYMLPTNVGYSGTPFTSGLTGDGALAGTFNVTADSTSVGGANCATVNSVSKGLGGIWLSANVAEPAPISGNCSEFNRVGTFPNCLTRAAFGKVTVKGPGKAKRNKATTYTVRVPNSGEATATGVKVAVKGKGVDARANGGSIAGKKAKSVKVKVKAKRAGKVKLTFTVTGKGLKKKTVTKTITVR